LPADLLQTGFAIRNSLLDGDGLADTGISLQVHPSRSGDACDPNLVVSLVVQFSNGQTFDYGFTPTRSNPMGYYFGCALPQPLRFSPSQIAIVQESLLRGRRSELIAKRMAPPLSAFSDANGWSAAQYYSTIDFPDVNGDAFADVCGRGSAGVWCAISNGTSFGTATQWTGNFDDALGWNGAQYYSIRT
jgi:hypothetical protein